MGNMLMNNNGLTMEELFRKRDMIKGLVDLGYDLDRELNRVEEIIERHVSLEFNHEPIR